MTSALIVSISPLLSSVLFVHHFKHYFPPSHKRLPSFAFYQRIMGQWEGANILLFSLISIQGKETSSFIFLLPFFSFIVAFPLDSSDQEARMLTLALLNHHFVCHYRKCGEWYAQLGPPIIQVQAEGDNACKRALLCPWQIRVAIHRCLLEFSQNRTIPGQQVARIILKEALSFPQEPGTKGSCLLHFSSWTFSQNCRKGLKCLGFSVNDKEWFLKEV